MTEDESESSAKIHNRKRLLDPNYGVRVEKPRGIEVDFDSYLEKKKREKIIKQILER